jgi:hypothetical protein
MVTSRPQKAPSTLCFRVFSGEKGNRISGTYEIYRKFDPHRPYQSFLFSISYIVKDPSIGTNALTKVKFRVSEAL